METDVDIVLQICGEQEEGSRSKSSLVLRFETSTDEEVSKATSGKPQTDRHSQCAADDKAASCNDVMNARWCGDEDVFGDWDEP